MRKLMLCMKKHIPNLLTSFNLLCGLSAIYLATEGKLEQAGIAISLAAIFDFTDGLSARLLKAYSDIGKQLDSLSDMVSFGVAPTFIMLQLISNSLCSSPYSYLRFAAFLLPVAAAWRLAKFNIDNSQIHSFKGIPSPAAALAVAALPFVITGSYSLQISALSCPPRLVAITLFFSYGMLADWHLLSFKFKNTKWIDNKMRYILVLCSITLFIVFGIAAILFILLLYILLSYIDNKMGNN